MLKPAFLGINEQAHSVLVGAGAQGLHAGYGAVVGCFFGSSEELPGLNFLEDGHIGHTRHFEYRKGNEFRAVGLIDGGQNFVAGVVVAAVAAFAFH